MVSKNYAWRAAPLHAAIVSGLFTSSVFAAGTWYDARNDAMGGTGVASSSWGSAVLANPALMTRAKPDDRAAIIFPSAGLQVTDKDKMIDKVDDINDTINQYKDIVNNLTILDYLNGYPQLKSASADVANRLRDLRGNKAHANAGVALAVTIPDDTLPFAFVTKAYGTVSVRANVADSDIALLDGVANGTVIPSLSDRNNLKSTANGLAALTTDYGIAVAHEFDVGGHPVSLGITPKIQQTWLYNYTASIYSYKKNDLNSSRYRNSNTGFNIDAGVATPLAEEWTLGVTGQNLISRNLRTIESNGYSDTYQIRPLVTSGVAWDHGPFTAALDVDLTKTRGFQSVADSQYAGIGGEYRVLDWLALRAGYRADMRSNDENVVTAGFGLSPFNHAVHLDLAGSVGSNRTRGAMLQLGFNF